MNLLESLVGDQSDSIVSELARQLGVGAVSYTHLTLPTIYSV